MTTQENQKVVTNNKSLCDANHLYAITNIDAMRIAMNKLKPNTYKIWDYLNKNQDKYTFALSKTDVMNFCKISRSTYFSSISELIETGYLVQDGDGSNHYNFYDIPPSDADIIVTVNRLGV